MVNDTTTKLTRAQVKAFLGGMTVRGMAGFVGELEEDWGVEAFLGGPARVEVVKRGDEDLTPPPEYDLVLVSHRGHRITVIKTIREMTNMSLMEAKRFMDPGHTLCERVTLEEANAFKERLEPLGARFELILRG